MIHLHGKITLVAAIAIVMITGTRLGRQAESTRTNSNGLEVSETTGAKIERDPVAGLQDGHRATFTIPRQPVRRRIHGIESFNLLRGGDHFFVPSITGLNWIATLQG
jgi:hypothetical protein